MRSTLPLLKMAALTLSLPIFCLSNLKGIQANTLSRLEKFEPIEILVPPPRNIQFDKPSSVCSSNVTKMVNGILARPHLKGSKWGVLIQTIGGETVYSRSPDSYMIPASNIKLLVTAAALQKLNPSGKIRSSSIRDWIITTNLRSNNNYANVLLRYLGGYPSVRNALSSIGIDPNGYRLKDGSGLSRNNLATPRTLVSTLRAMHNAKGKEIFLASLPIAGESGTLRNRLRSTSAQGIVRAKTGTLRGVRALSGYLETDNYGTLAFSAIANQPTNRADSDLVKALDEIVSRLSNLRSCDR